MWNRHVLLYNSPPKVENWIGGQKKEEKVVTLNMCNQHAIYRTYLLNLRIVLENRKKKREWLLLTNCPCEICTTHYLNLRIGLKNRKKKKAVTLKGDWIYCIINKAALSGTVAMNHFHSLKAVTNTVPHSTTLPSLQTATVQNSIGWLSMKESSRHENDHTNFHKNFFARQLLVDW